MRIQAALLIVVVGLLVSLATARTVDAERFTSPSYTIDASSVGESLGSPQSSSSYRLTSAGGESVVGAGTGGSYKLGQGYVAQLEKSLEISVTPAPLNLGTVAPGVSISGDLTATVKTDAPDYTLGVHQDHDLQSGAHTIDPVSGSIASPVTWTEGTTKGLGFTLVSTTATAIPPAWGPGTAYAAFPDATTTFYTRTGYTGGATDSLTMRVRLDVPTAQPMASYTNVATWTGTMTP